MHRFTRTRCAIIALALWTQACSTYRPPPALTSLTVGRRVRVSSSSPFALGQPAFASSPATVCRASVIEGILVRAAGDVLILDGLRDVIAVADGGACPVGQSVAITLVPTMEVMEHRVDRARTTAALFGAAVAVTGFVAFTLRVTAPPQ